MGQITCVIAILGKISGVIVILKVSLLLLLFGGDIITRCVLVVSCVFVDTSCIWVTNG